MKTKRVVLAGLIGMLFASRSIGADSMVLQHKHKPGTVQSYLLKGSLEGDMNCIPGSGDKFHIKANTECRLTVKIVSVDDQGIALQQMKQERMKATVDTGGGQTTWSFDGVRSSGTSSGEPKRTPYLPGMVAFGETVKAKIDEHGRVLRMEPTTFGVLAAGFGPSSIQEMILAFPERPIAVGESWTQEMSIPLNVAEVPALSVNVRYSLAGIEQYKGREVVRIDVKGTIPTGWTLRGGFTMLFARFTRDYSGYILFDRSEGRVLYGKVKFVQNIAQLSAPAQPDGVVKSVGDFEVTTDDVDGQQSGGKGG